MSTVSSPPNSDGSFIIVPQNLSNFRLFDEDMVENELIHFEPDTTQTTKFHRLYIMGQTTAQGTGNKLGQVQLQGHTTCTR
jgi:hypothetical protein